MAITIASYNLWNGSKETYNRLVDYIKSQHIDVLCLQEINGWQDDNFSKLNDFMDRAGFTDNEYGNSNSEYKLASLTTLPVISKTVHQEGFWHCVVEIHVKVGDKEIVIFNVHLDPWKEDPRVKEIEKVLNKVDPTKFTIITGDFNSLSRQDNYPPEFMNTLQQRKFYKFGQDTLDYRVTDALASAGFVDAAAKFNHMEITAPTPYGEAQSTESVPVSEVPARIDYAFVSSNLAPLLTDYKVLKDESTDKISDHYPITLTIETDPNAQSTPSPTEAQEIEAAAPTEAIHPNIDAVLKLLEKPIDPAAGNDKPAEGVSEVPPPSQEPPKPNIDDEGTLIIKHDD
jgi:exodeoxyribonuclease III